MLCPYKNQTTVKTPAAKQMGCVGMQKMGTIPFGAKARRTLRGRVTAVYHRFGSVDLPSWLTLVQKTKRRRRTDRAGVPMNSTERLVTQCAKGSFCCAEQNTTCCDDVDGLWIDTSNYQLKNLNPLWSTTRAMLRLLQILLQ